MYAVLLVPVLCLSGSYGLDYGIQYEWTSLDYEYSNEQSRQDDIASGRFIPENNAISGIKLYDDVIFLSVPRWKPGVPSTLNAVPKQRVNNRTAPKLVPFPSWDMQELGNCAKFQYVQSMEVDHFGNLWVVDVGRVNLVTQPINVCPPKLVVLDLNKDEIVRLYEFPDNVAPHDTNFMVQIVIECPAVDGMDPSKSTGAVGLLDDCYAYISDAQSASLIVYHYGGNSSWRFQHPSMNADPTGLQFNMMGQSFTLNASVDGIALSPVAVNQNRTLFYCPLSSYNLFSVDTSLLKNPNSTLDGHVTLVGNKTSQSGGLTMANNGLLYYSLLGMNALYSWNISTPFVVDNQRLLAQSNQDLQLVDKFGFDTLGYLWFTSINVQIYFSEFLNNTFNFRVMYIFVDAGSYMQQMISPRDTVVDIGGGIMDTNGTLYNTSSYSSTTDMPKSSTDAIINIGTTTPKGKKNMAAGLNGRLSTALFPCLLQLLFVISTL